VSWQSLQGANLVLQDYASGSRPLIDAALAAQGVQATIVQEITPGHAVSDGGSGIGISVFRHWRCLCRREAACGKTFTPVSNAS
jgi:hypothetical protein